MKGLVYIGKIVSIFPIKNADRIESVEVVCGDGGKWKGTVQKGQFKNGDLCQVYLQDSLLPHTEEFAFMENKEWRVKMMKLRGVPSEVLIMPQTIVGDVGDDITQQANVEKYEKQIPVGMGGEIYGSFPSFIPKTDEPNFQKVPEMVESLRGKRFYSTVKVDGSSATIYKYNEHFGCCSRNWERKESDSNIIWQIAKEYEWDKILPDGFAFQFEIAGPGIQKNPMGLKKVQPFIFNIYDIKNNCYIPDIFYYSYTPTIEIVDYNKIFNFKSDDDLRKYAEGKYPNGRQREGIVIRPMISDINNERISFKVINLLYKEK